MSKKGSRVAALSLARRVKRADGGEVSYDPMTGMRIGADLERSEPEAAPNRYARATIQSIANTPKAMLWDAPRELGEAVERMPMPGAERTPENEAAMQDAAGQSFMAAVGTAGASMPFAQRGAAGIFGGKLAQTADHAALARAEKLEGLGEKPEYIHQETGWFRGADGNWRFEIDDGLSGFRRQVGRGTIDNYPISSPHTTDVGSAYQHPELAAAYPDLMQSDLSFYHHPGSDTRGSYRPPVAENPGDLIPPPGEQINIRTPDDRYGKNMDQTRSTMLHELQHAVQTREGFAPGSSPSAMQHVAQPVEDARKLIEFGSPFEFAKAMGRQPHPAATGLVAKLTPEELARVETDPYELYRRVAGEVEARNVQARRDFQPWERRTTFPGWTEDIPREKQLIGASHDPAAPSLPAAEEAVRPGAAPDPAAVGSGGGGSSGAGGLPEAQAAAARWAGARQPLEGLPGALKIGDAHFSRGVGLSDTRKGPSDVQGSFSTSEYQTLQPWWQHEVAGPVGLESVPAQARLWTALGPQTGVESELGAPKLELLAKQIMEAARRLRVSPETARDMVLSGKAGAGVLAGGVLAPGAIEAMREHHAKGGKVSNALALARDLKRASGGKVHVGPIVGDTGGRADKVPMEVPDGSYVIPADICSALGEGNTDAGMKKLGQMFPKSKPSLMRGLPHSGVPIQAADGEFVISPQSITDRWGDLESGHRYLDKWVLNERAILIKTLEGLAPPAQD